MNFTRLFYRFLLPLFLLIPASALWAQVGNDNPAGVGGMFNGNVTTGGSYDPYTGNATRTITDIVVAGAVGDYGLSYARTWNSRTSNLGWLHQHSWRIEAAPNGLAAPQVYTVYFPDGREEYFAPSSPDIYYRTAPGARERLQRWDATTGMAYLILSDGGKVEFTGIRTQHNDLELIPPSWFEYEFTATAIIDPHGRRTTYTYDTYGRLFQITEPAGRWIKIYYTPDWLVDYIQASDGRQVDYTYQTQAFSPGTVQYSVLTNVAYYGDPSLNATYTYRTPNTGGVNGPPLLFTCNDVMFAGPMKQIAYQYRVKANDDGSDAVYGQISNESKPSGGPAVTALSINVSTTGDDIRVETRSDGRQRTFTYAGGYLMSWTDFNNVTSSQTYDNAMYVNSRTDGRHNTTEFTNNLLTGVVTEIRYPLTPGDTPPGTPQGKVKFNYGGTGCFDPGQDINNPYYLCTATDEAGHETRFTRDSHQQITRVDYPDTAYETFAYDYTTYFGQLMSHRMKTGGMESFSYDNRGLRQTFRNPDTATAPNPTARYQYDGLDRVSGITDTLGSALGDQYHTTNYVYNGRGQVTTTTLPIDPVDGQRHTIVKDYSLSGDGTLVKLTDQLNHVTLYTYDDYRRLRTVTTSRRFSGDTIPRTTSVSYDRDCLTGDDYRHTDSNVTRLTMPSGNIVKSWYDNNHRKTAETVSGPAGTDAATTSYVYDDAGNLTKLLSPDEQPGQSNYGKYTLSVYDERNRPMSITDAMNHPPTVFTYDAGGRNKTVTQSNGQTITYDLYDTMNRLLQQTAKQTTTLDAVTKYTYAASGLQITMQDPHLAGGSFLYTYQYDQMDRLVSLTYPPDSWSGQRTELYTYDTAGRPLTYTSRDGNVQTFSHDALNRQTGFSWSGAGASSVTIGYDIANRMTSIVNADATIGRIYYDDNLLKTETETPQGGTANSVTYAWNEDGNLESIIYPSLRKYHLNYTGRNQLRNLQEQDTFSYYYQAEYVYDVNGNMATRKVGTNVAAFGITTDASQRDALGRSTHVGHQFAGPSPATRTFDYVFDNMGNRTSIKRDNNVAPDIYGYDFAQQATTGLDSGNPHTYGYDGNGNRTNMNGTGTYVTNNLNQQTTFDGDTVNYDVNGNVATYGTIAVYGYDSQNRLTSVNNDGAISTFKYDGLNRKVSQIVGGVTTYNVWDGWNLIEERGTSNALINTYIYGAGEIVERITGTTPTFYFQDALGNTSHVSDAAGNVLESYRYDTFGLTSAFAPGGAIRKGGSAYDIRHLFTGQLWMPQAGLYDYRNRVYSTSLTRFLQPDPIGFRSDRSNLYRYCGNNSVNWSDPSGTVTRQSPKPLPQLRKDGNDGVAGYYNNTPFQPGFAGGVLEIDDTGMMSNEPLVGTGSFADGFDNGFDRMSGGYAGDRGGGAAGEGGHGDGGGGGGPSGGSGRRYSGNTTVEWWPKSLTLPYTKPATPEQAAWTETGKWPTLIAAGVVFGPLAVPETVLPYSYAAANAVLANPHHVAWVGLAFHQFISPSGPTGTGPAVWGAGPEVWGAGIHQLAQWMFPDLGP